MNFTLTFLLSIFRYLDSWPSEVSIIASLEFIHRCGAGNLRFLTRIKVIIASARQTKELRARQRFPLLKILYGERLEGSDSHSE